MNRILPDPSEPIEPVSALAQPTCGRTDNLGKQCGQPCEEIIRRDRLDDLEHPPPRMRYFTGLCRLHGEMEFSARWQRRWAAAANDTDRQRQLIDERRRWEEKGHVYRGVSERGAV